MRRFQVLVLVMLLASCAPEVGSEAWCEAMEEKPKGDWTTNEAGDFAKHCVFQEKQIGQMSVYNLSGHPTENGDINRIMKYQPESVFI